MDAGPRPITVTSPRAASALSRASLRETMGFTLREGWVFLKIPRGDIDGVGEVK